MVPKYKEDLKEMGFFISGKSEIKFKNKSKQREEGGCPIQNIKNKYALARDVGVKPAGYLLGGIWFLSQLPLEIYNNLEEFPKIEKSRGEYFYSGPSIQEFLDKRKKFIPIEKISKNIKDTIVHNFLNND